MSEQSGSQTVESQEPQEQAIQDAMSMFGLDTPTEQLEASDSQPEQPADEHIETPAIEDEKPSKTIKVKHNKEEIEVDVSDDKLPEYVQRSLALDKERERKSELEKNLDRAAKLAGFENHAEYVANFDRLEQQAKQQKDDMYANMREQLRQEAEDAGLDPSKVEAYYENHPLLQQAKQTLVQQQRMEIESKLAQTEQAKRQQWGELYQQYPELAETSKAFDDGGTPEWFTSEMQSLVNQGYQPLHAYKLAHMEKLTAQTRKQAEQKAIKDQRLGLRSQVETQGSADLEPEVPDSMTAAFAMFGLDPKSARKYVKK